MKSSLVRFIEDVWLLWQKKNTSWRQILILRRPSTFWHGIRSYMTWTSIISSYHIINEYETEAKCSSWKYLEAKIPQFSRGNVHNSFRWGTLTDTESPYTWRPAIDWFGYWKKDAKVDLQLQAYSWGIELNNLIEVSGWMYTETRRRM